MLVNRLSLLLALLPGLRIDFFATEGLFVVDGDALAFFPPFDFLLFPFIVLVFNDVLEDDLDG